MPVLVIQAAVPFGAAEKKAAKGDECDEFGMEVRKTVKK